MIFQRTEPPAIGAPELKRNITYFETTAITIGLVIGSGIFLKPGAVLVHAGSPAGAILAWIAAGLVTLCAALSISEIAARLPQVGGLYVYLSELYGETWGFLYGWAQTIISSPGSVAALAIAFAKLGAHFFPFSALEQKLLAISLIAFTVMTQIIGTKLSVVLQTISTAGKLLPLATLIVLGLIKGKAGGFHFSCLRDPSEGAGFGLAMLGALWAYDGWINAATLGGEVIEPEKKLPRGIITGVLTVMAVYTLFNIILFKVFSADEVAASPQAGVDAAVVLFGASGGA